MSEPGPFWVCGCRSRNSLEHLFCPACGTAAPKVRPRAVNTKALARFLMRFGPALLGVAALSFMWVRLLQPPPAPPVACARAAIRFELEGIGYEVHFPGGEQSEQMENMPGWYSVTGPISYRLKAGRKDHTQATYECRMYEYGETKRDLVVDLLRVDGSALPKGFIWRK